ncbi:efflux RND transporter periplasmic adaptor subunit [Ferrimonas balearica]|uniref:efflux RND transporter periplasmic adaptor subunit n=1 Tax=Ferrimonas balearica TaxID=44012 RepID=UPI001C99137A|nr:efflux RND transporter periplasmic adaptor subunit [Ferrimonas balearica]MBY5991860.1 efflux RND transporter periplasmic adaptor subunit [Ferrimonas balearica]
MSYQKLNLLWFVLLVLALLLMSGCTPQQPPVEAPPMAVEVITVGNSETGQERTFNGQVVAADLTQLAFRIDGKLDQLNVRPGQSVSQGQLLATLVDRTQRQALTDAQAQFTLMDRQFQRASALLAQGSVSQAELDELSANRRLAQANLKAAQAQLRYTQLHAPFDGVIAEVPKERFETLSPGEPVATLYRSDRVDVQIAVPDLLLSQIDPQAQSIGYRPLAQFDGEPSRHTMGYLEHTLELDPQSRAFQLWLSMPSQARPLRPGQPVTVNVDLEAAGLSLPQGHRVPLTALEAAQQPGQFRVWKVSENRVTPVAVRVGAITQQGALVDSGLSIGDTLAVSGLARLSPEMTVNPVPATQEAQQ